MPMMKKTSSNTFTKLATDKPQKNRKDSNDFSEVYPLISNGTEKSKRKNSFGIDELESPLKTLIQGDSEFVYGWFVSKDEKYAHFYDIDYMIELGRASGNFSEFKRLLKGQEM